MPFPQNDFLHCVCEFIFIRRSSGNSSQHLHSLLKSLNRNSAVIFIFFFLFPEGFQFSQSHECTYLHNNPLYFHSSCYEKKKKKKKERRRDPKRKLRVQNVQFISTLVHTRDQMKATGPGGDILIRKNTVSDKRCD